MSARIGFRAVHPDFRSSHGQDAAEMEMARQQSEIEALR